MHFVTLTARHKTDTKKEAGEIVAVERKAWKAIHRWLNRQNWRYIRVAEPGDSPAHIHYHMVVLGATDEQVEKFVGKWVANLNKFGNSASVRAQNIQRCENIRNLGGYISKYIAKTFEGGETETWFWRWMELCYSCRLRVFSMDCKTSKAISEKYKKPV